jgi:hypothetical protein
MRPNVAQHERYCIGIAKTRTADRAALGDITNANPDAHTRARFQAQSLKRKMEDNLIDMKMQHTMTHAGVSAVRVLLNQVVSEMSDAARDMSDTGDCDEDDTEEDASLFEEAENWRKHLASERAEYPYIQPKQKIIETEGKPDGKLNYFSIIDLIKRRLFHDKAFRLRADSKSKELRKGEKYKKPPTGTIADTLDATKARFSRLHAPSDDEDEIRLAGILQVDDVEVVLRTSTGTPSPLPSPPPPQSPPPPPPPAR